MKPPSLVTDNIAELLVKILEFTQTRQKVLTRNINNLRSPGFVPCDLDVDEFSELLRAHRLLLRDTENIKFGPSGAFQVEPVPDDHAKKLLEHNPDQYIELQINKLMQNSINQKIATELLKQKQGAVSIFD